MAAQSAAEQDQSMEEILQSIKRIIADEEEEAEYDNTAEQRAAGSDVLELTEVVQDDGTVVQEDKPAAQAPMPEPDPEPEPEPEPEPDPEPEVPPASSFEPVPTAALTQPEAAPDTSHAEESADMPISSNDLDLDNLVSEEVASATSESLRYLASRQQDPKPRSATTSSPAFRSGETVEDLVVEALRPMLKAWLEENLQRIVEDRVEREVRRIAGN